MAIKTVEQNDEYLATWKDQKGYHAAVADLSEGLAEIYPVKRPGRARRPQYSAKASNAYRHVGPANISIRDEFGKRDYDRYRPDEASPLNIKEKIHACVDAYENIGICKNVLDLMSDYVVKGIDVVHKNKAADRLYKYWFHNIVKGVKFSERFANNAFKISNLIIYTQNGEIPVSDAAYIKRSKIADAKVKKTSVNPIIPTKFTIFNPCVLEVLSDKAEVFLDNENILYGIRLPTELVKRVKFPRTDADKDLIKNLPDDLLEFIRTNTKNRIVYPLPPEKLSTFFYKKDDWQIWANPMLAPILTDLELLDKMKLADLSALDGAISQIRIWKLGDLKEKILPKKASLQKFSEVLTNAVAGGVVDIVWGPAIDLIETTTNLHNFLGETKYLPTLNAIRIGLGIPTILSGVARVSGFTNNYIELQTFVERLQYVRNGLKEFWNKQFVTFQKALGLKRPAELVFDKHDLTDEATRLNILMNLADRNYISPEYLQETIGINPEIEGPRIIENWKKREEGTLPPKAGPFYNPQQREKLEAIFAQSGSYSPEDFGLEFENKESNKRKPVDIDMELQKQKVAMQPKGQPGQGRPKGKNDQSKRKQKTVKPRSAPARAKFVYALAWADDIQQKIADVVNKVYLKSVGKDNMRQLTTAEAESVEDFKFAILCNLSIGAPFDETIFKSMLGNPLDIPQFHKELYSNALANYVKSYGKEPAMEKLRQLRAGTVALANSADYFNNNLS